MAARKKRKIKAMKQPQTDKFIVVKAPPLKGVICGFGVALCPRWNCK
jgi:hypothetical protein